MNVFIWDALDRISSNYHSGGGVVVIAESVDDARAQFLATYEPYDVGDESDILTTEPTLVVGCTGEVTPVVFKFPDAGCC